MLMESQMILQQKQEDVGSRLNPCELGALGTATRGERVWTELLPIAKSSANEESQLFILHGMWAGKGTLVQIQNPMAFGSGQMGTVRKVSFQDGCDDDSADFLLDCAGQTSLCPSFLKHSSSQESAVKLFLYQSLKSAREALERCICSGHHCCS